MKLLSRRRMVWIAGGTVALVLGAWLVLPRVLAPVIRGKLEALVGEHLHASVHIGGLRYTLPYTITLQDVRLVANVGAELLAATRLEVTLAELPLKRGPLLVERIMLVEPTFRWTRLPTGEVAVTTVIKTDAPPSDAHSGGAPAPRKLSDLLRTRTVDIRNGRIIVENRAVANSVPMVWQNINTDLDVAPADPGSYAITFKADHAPVSTVSASGTLDIDRLALDLKELVIRADAGAGTTGSALPAVVQQWLARCDARGKITVRVRGHFPFGDLPASEVHGTIETSGVALHAPWSDEFVARDLDSVATLLKRPRDPNLALAVEHLAARVTTPALPDPAGLSIRRFVGEFDRSTFEWKVTELLASVAPPGGGTASISGSVVPHFRDSNLTASLHGIRLRPPTFERAIEDVRGTVRLSDRRVHFQSLSGMFVGDAWSLDTATWIIDALPDQVRIENIAGNVHFRGDAGPLYPGIGTVVGGLSPSGLYTVQGTYARNLTLHGRRHEYSLVVRAQEANLAPTRRKIPLTRVRGDATITESKIDIRELRADFFGGDFAAAGTIDPRRPVSFSMQATAEDVDLAQVAAFFPIEGERNLHLSGTAGAVVKLSGDSPNRDSLRGNGELELHRARLWEGKVLRHVVTEVKLAEKALADAEAACVFSIVDSGVNIKSAAVYSTELGVQGSGRIGFDGTLDMGVVAAPLGDWERQMKKLRIPLVGDVAAATLGGFQKMMNAVATPLLYQFRVTGRFDDPQVQTVPVPILTEPVADIFGRMLQRPSRLIEALPGRDPQVQN